MAVPENNRRPLPRVNNNETRELQRRAAETDKKVQGNINDIRTFAQRTEKAEQSIQDGNRQIQDIKKKFEKQEKDVVRLQNDVKATDQKATKALNDSAANTSKISQLEKSGSISKIKNSFASLRRDFGSNNQTLQASVGSLRTNLDSSILNFKTADQGAEQRLQTIQTSLNDSLLNFRTKEEQIGQRITANTQSIDNISTQLNVSKVDFAKSIETVVADNRQDKESILALSANVDALKKTELADEKARQKELRIGAADKRREIKENILEGSKKALANTGNALARSTNSLLGGFNLIDAIKSVLSKLALGLLIVKFPEIYKNITTNIEEWKRVAALFVKNFLRPVKAFFSLIVDVGIKLVKWVFKGVNLIRKAIGSIIGFTFNAGKKLIQSVLRFLGKLFDAGKDLLRPGGKAASEAANQALQRGGKNAAGAAANQALQGGGKNAAGEVAQSPLQRFANWSGNMLRSGAIATRDAAVSIDGKLTGGKVTGAIGDAFNVAKDKFKEIFSKLKDAIAPASNAINGLKGGFKKALGEGPAAFSEFFSKSVSKVSGIFSGIQKKISGPLSVIGPLAKQLGSLPGGEAFLKNFVRGAGRTNPLTSFPIDYLLNRYLIGQQHPEALQRAVGSTLGSAIGGGLGTAFGGPLAPLLAPISSFVGGEIGDYMVARMNPNFSTKGTSVKMLSDYIPALNNWLNEDTGASENGAGGMSKISPSTSTKGTSGASGFNNTNTVVDISPSPSSQAAATVPVSQYLRKPSRKSSSSSTGTTSSSGASPSMAQITLPPQTVDMPTQVIGDRGESLDKTPAQSIPSISPSNPAMDYLQLAAAQEFEMQLV